MESTSKRVVWLRFLLSPVEVIAGDGANSENVGGLRLVRNRLEGEPGRQRAVPAEPNDAGEVVPCGLVVRSVGFGMTPLEGLPHERGYVPHVQGRVKGEDGLYVSGWCKRGPKGIIGTNIHDAQETVFRLFADLQARGPSSTADMNIAESALASVGKRVVSFSDWRKIETEEHRRGAAENRPAVKFTNIEEMLQLL